MHERVVPYTNTIHGQLLIVPVLVSYYTISLNGLAGCAIVSIKLALFFLAIMQIMCNIQYIANLYSSTYLLRV